MVTVCNAVTVMASLLRLTNVLSW